MAVEQEEQPIRAWFLIKSSVIDEFNWDSVTDLIRNLNKGTSDWHVYRADWVEGTYDIVVPVFAKDNTAFETLEGKIRDLVFNPNIVDDMDVVKVKEHKPPTQDPLRDNEWG